MTDSTHHIEEARPPPGFSLPGTSGAARAGAGGALTARREVAHPRSDQS